MWHEWAWKWGRVRCGGMGEKSHPEMVWPYIEMMEDKEFVKKMYQSNVEGPNRRGRPLGRYEDKVREYVSKRGARGNRLERARRECMDMERWRAICHGHPLWGGFQRELGIAAID